MKVLTISEGKFGRSKTIFEWLTTLKELPRFGHGFSIPKDAGEKTALARLIVAIFESLQNSEVVVYVSEWGILAIE